MFATETLPFPLQSFATDGCQSASVVNQVCFHLLHALSTPFRCMPGIVGAGVAKVGLRNRQNSNEQNWYKPSVYLASCCCHFRLMSSLHFPFSCSMSIVIPILFSTRPCTVFGPFFPDRHCTESCCFRFVFADTVASSSYILFFASAVLDTNHSSLLNVSHHINLAKMPANVFLPFLLTLTEKNPEKMPVGVAGLGETLLWINYCIKMNCLVFYLQIRKLRKELLKGM